MIPSWSSMYLTSRQHTAVWKFVWRWGGEEGMWLVLMICWWMMSLCILGSLIKRKRERKNVCCIKWPCPWVTYWSLIIDHWPLTPILLHRCLSSHLSLAFIQSEGIACIAGDSVWKYRWVMGDGWLILLWWEGPLFTRVWYLGLHYRSWIVCGGHAMIADFDVGRRSRDIHVWVRVWVWVCKCM